MYNRNLNVVNIIVIFTIVTINVNNVLGHDSSRFSRDSPSFIGFRKLCYNVMQNSSCEHKRSECLQEISRCFKPTRETSATVAQPLTGSHRGRKGICV